jgi:RNA polymerase sigma-70 factor (ECF subfamily)
MTHTTEVIPIDVSAEMMSDVACPVPLVDAHRDEIFRYLVRRLDRAEVLDAFADVVAVARRHIREAPAADGLLWLCSIARRVVAARRPRTTTSCPRCATRVAPARDGDGADLLSIVDQLAERDREVLRLAAWEGFTTAQIAMVSGLTERTVQLILDKVTELLRDGVEPRRDETADDSMWRPPEVSS